MRASARELLVPFLHLCYGAATGFESTSRSEIGRSTGGGVTVCFEMTKVRLFKDLKKVHIEILGQRIEYKNPRGGGGTLIFASYVGSGPASFLRLKNIRNFKHPKQIFEILATPKNIPHSVP